MPNPIYGAKSNFIGSLVNSKPFSIGSNPVPDLNGILGKKNIFGDTRPTTPANLVSPTGGTAPIATPPPAKTSYVNNVASQQNQPQQQSAPPNFNPNTNFQVQGGGQAPNAYTSAFNQYIDSLKPSNEETGATKYLNDLVLQGKRDQEKALASGETTGFATGEAARVNRENAFGIDAATNAVNSFTASREANANIAKARADYEKSILPDKSTDTGFSLSPGQKRYDSSGNLIASSPKDTSGIGGFNGTLSPLALAVQNGTIALDKVPSAQRAQVAAELAQSGLPGPREQALGTSLDVVNSLLEQDTNAITGVGQNPLNFAGLTNQKALNLYGQLKGILSLENRQQLKGQGAISDFEFKVLADAASSLGRNLNNADFRSALEKIKDVFEGKYSNAQGQQSNNQPLNLTGQPQAFTLDDGTTVTLQPDGTYK